MIQVVCMKHCLNPCLINDELKLAMRMNSSTCDDKDDDGYIEWVV